MTVTLTFDLAAVGLEATRTAMAGATLRIYRGTVPTDVDAALGDAVLLAEMTLASPAFNAATASGDDVICVNPATITDPTANEGGLASFFRVICATTTRQAQGTVGVIDSGADMEMAQPNLVAGSPVDISSLTLAQARK